MTVNAIRKEFILWVFVRISVVWRIERRNEYAKTKAQISFAVNAKLISAFVFAIWIVQSLFFMSMKFQISNLLL